MGGDQDHLQRLSEGGGDAGLVPQAAQQVEVVLSHTGSAWRGTLALTKHTPGFYGNKTNVTRLRLMHQQPNFSMERSGGGEANPTCEGACCSEQ